MKQVGGEIVPDAEELILAAGSAELNEFPFDESRQKIDRRNGKGSGGGCYDSDHHRRRRRQRPQFVPLLGGLATAPKRAGRPHDKYGREEHGADEVAEQQAR